MHVAWLLLFFCTLYVLGGPFSLFCWSSFLLLSSAYQGFFLSFFLKIAFIVWPMYCHYSCFIGRVDILGLARHCVFFCLMPFIFCGCVWTWFARLFQLLAVYHGVLCLLFYACVNWPWSVLVGVKPELPATLWLLSLFWLSLASFYQWRSLFSSSRDRGTEKIYLSRRCKCCPPPPQGQGEGRCLCGSSAVRSEDCCVQPAQECQEVLLGDD